MRPTRVPRPDDVEAFNAYIEARAESAARQARRALTERDEIDARRRERRLLRLLVAMVASIVLGGFVISIVVLLLSGGGGGGQ